MRPRAPLAGDPGSTADGGPLAGGPVEGGVADTPASRIAADTLATALVAVAASWWFGLDQVIPGLVLLAGCWRLWRRGELRLPPEAWAWILLGVWSLASMAALDGAAELVLFARGEVHLLVALCAYLVGLSVAPEGPAFARFLRVAMVFLGLLALTSLLVMTHLLPLYIPSPLRLVWPELETRSDFVNQLVLSRRLGTLSGVSLLKGVRRQSLFFIYQGGLMTVLLLLQGWLLVARHRLRGFWRDRVPLALVLGLVIGPLTGSRSGLLLAWGVLAALAFWSAIADKPWRRGAIRVAAALVLAAALLAVIPVGDSTSLERGAAWERVLTDFRVNSFLDRVEVYQQTLARLGERPWTGWAIQGRPGEGGRYLRLGTHSEWLNVAYRFGYVGLGLFVAAGVLYAGGLARRFRRRPEGPAVLLTLAALAATGLVRTFQWDLNVLWLAAAFLGTAKALLTSGAPARRRGRVSMLGAELDPMTVADLHREIGAAVAGGGRVVIGHQNLHGIYLLQREPAMRAFARRADRIFFDGMALVYLARWLGYDVGRRHRVTYADWIGPLARECAERGWRVFHLGGRPGVGARAAAILRARHPGLEIESLPGYFEDSRGAGVTRAIAAFRPDLLMVGMGMPRQEAWVAAHVDALEVPAVLTCGACMDYVAGVVATPPRWAGRVGLEWGFRLIAEPRRLGYRYLVEPWSVARLFASEWWTRNRRGASRSTDP